MLIVNPPPLVSEWLRRARTGKQIGSRQTHREIERWRGFQGRQSVFFLWAVERDSCHLQTKPHFLWLSPSKYSICQCHGPGVLPRRAASRVCWLCRSPIYIRYWQHHHVPNVPLACSCSTPCSRSLFLCFYSLSVSDAPFASLRPLYHGYTRTISHCLDSSVISYAQWSPNCLLDSGVWGLSLYAQTLREFSYFFFYNLCLEYHQLTSLSSQTLMRVI